MTADVCPQFAKLVKGFRTARDTANITWKENITFSSFLTTDVASHLIINTNNIFLLHYYITLCIPV